MGWELSVCEFVAIFGSILSKYESLTMTLWKLKSLKAYVCNMYSCVHVYKCDNITFYFTNY